MSQIKAGDVIEFTTKTGLKYRGTVNGLGEIVYDKPVKHTEIETKVVDELPSKIFFKPVSSIDDLYVKLVESLTENNILKFSVKYDGCKRDICAVPFSNKEVDIYSLLREKCKMFSTGRKYLNHGLVKRGYGTVIQVLSRYKDVLSIDPCKDVNYGCRKMLEPVMNLESFGDKNAFLLIYLRKT